MHSVNTRISFEAAHRLYDVETYSKECRQNLHGHSYYVDISISCQQLNEAGMVIDFKLLKKILKGTIKDRYDHSCILRECDPLAKPISENCRKFHIIKENPTAEWMAQEFAKDIQDALIHYGHDELTVDRVAVQETENNIAVWNSTGTVTASDTLKSGEIFDGRITVPTPKNTTFV